MKSIILMGNYNDTVELVLRWRFRLPVLQKCVFHLISRKIQIATPAPIKMMRLLAVLWTATFLPGSTQSFIQGCGYGLTSIRIGIRIRIHNLIELGSNADPEPQQNMGRQIFF
jgi:hypothetical protein